MSFPYGQYQNLIANGSGSVIDIVTAVGASSGFSQIGVQAKPGTSFKIGENSFQVGPSGIYEFQGTISSLKISTTNQFIIDYKLKEA